MKTYRMTPETIQSVRKHFRDNALACANDAESGAMALPSHVNVADFAAAWRERASAWMRGDHDHTFTFLQFAHYTETGKSVPLLP